MSVHAPDDYSWCRGGFLDSLQKVGNRIADEAQALGTHSL